MVVSAIVLLATEAAASALLTLEDRWHAIHGEYRTSSQKLDTHGDDPPGLPGLLGGGNPHAAHAWGFKVARWLPLLFVIIWICLAARVSYDFVRIKGLPG